MGVREYASNGPVLLSQTILCSKIGQDTESLPITLSYLLPNNCININ